MNTEIREMDVEGRGDSYICPVFGSSFEMSQCNSCENSESREFAEACKVYRYEMGQAIVQVAKDFTFPFQ